MTKYKTTRQINGVVPHNPSSWPDAQKCDAEFMPMLRTIFDKAILDEIDNVISDAMHCNGSLDHRGYVVAIALMCALDTISSYGYGDRRGDQIPPFIRAHFPKDYHDHAKLILTAYRHMVVHSWHLFAAGISADGPAITFLKNVPCINLLHFRDALHAAVDDYFEKLPNDADLRTNTIKRYRNLRKKAKQAW